MGLKLIGYGRVSSEGQSENYSGEIQREAVERFCKANGHELVAWFWEVASGSSAKDREVYIRALGLLQSVDGLIAYRLDRLHRNTREFLVLLEDFIIAQLKRLIMLDYSGIDEYSDSGKFILTIGAGQAEYERKVIENRTKDGRRKKAADHGYAYGAPSYGKTAKDKKLNRNRKEENIIAEMRRLRDKGFSYREIAEAMNENNIASKRRKKNNKVQWHATTVRRILTRGGR